ncbi:MAG: hypothetical protein JSV09_09220 [Thermoplasmata archaeon]|nr:MAG: hypothetical protein JSV09_09220 [Thermoplasmata archaeon]
MGNIVQKYTPYQQQCQLKYELIDVVKHTPRKRVAIEAIKQFEISGVFFLNGDGTEIFHKYVPFNSKKDADIFNSMFQAVKIYIRDSPHSYGELRNVWFGGYKTLVEGDGEFFLVVIGKGECIKTVREDMKRIVESLNRRYGKTISYWDGDEDAFYGIKREFDMLTGSFRCKWAIMNEDQPKLNFVKGDTTLKKSKSTEDFGEEIKIPIEFMKRIDELIESGKTLYTSRDDFIKSAVETKLRELSNYKEYFTLG